jgi:hypothetical protein
MYTGNLLTFLEEGKMHPSGCFAANSSLTIFQMSLGLSLGFSFAASLHLMLKEMVQSRMPSALGLSDMFSGGTPCLSQHSWQCSPITAKMSFPFSSHILSLGVQPSLYFLCQISNGSRISNEINVYMKTDSPVVNTFIVGRACLDVRLPYPLPVMNKIILLPVVHPVGVPKTNIVTQMLEQSSLHTIIWVLAVYVICGLAVTFL